MTQFDTLNDLVCEKPCFTPNQHHINFQEKDKSVRSMLINKSIVVVMDEKKSAQ